jgi:hypothetical protein
MKNAMKLQGISTGSNQFYDFRPKFRNTTQYSLDNQATLDGTNGLCLVDGINAQSSIFGIHNQMVKPSQTGIPNFSAGFNTMGVQASPTDFVLNDALPFTGNSMEAFEEPEFIPFQLSYTPQSSDAAFVLQWRPDPALYLAVMTGQFEVEIDEIDFEGGANNALISFNVMVSGWKSIMGGSKPRKSSSKPRRRTTKKTSRRRK